MTQFLAIQNTYTHMQLALFNDQAMVAFTEIDKQVASKECIIALQELLEKNNTLFSQLSFIAVNQGPGPFTTLRVVISTVNGLSFAKKVPLIGVNALEGFLKEYEDTPFQNKVIFLNAFGCDVYYALQRGHEILLGCGSLQTILEEFYQKIPHDPILFLGNGVEKYYTHINATFGNRARFLDPNPQTVSLGQIGKMALQNWKEQEHIAFELQPYYYKSAYPVL